MLFVENALQKSFRCGEEDRLVNMGIGRFRQAHTAFACAFGSLMMGLVNTWPSYTTEILFSNTTTPLSAPITESEGALLGSLPSLGAMFGSAVAGAIINKFGRRNGGVLLSLPVLISWAIVSIAASIRLMFAARFMAGISGGGFLVLSPIFISEVAEDSIRGTLTSIPILCYCSGSLLSYVIGWCMTYRTIIWANLAFSLFGIILIMLTTESPAYLLRQKKDEDARLAIAKYRGVPVSSMAVLEEITKLKQEIMPSVELLSVTEIDPKVEVAEKEKFNPEQVKLAKTQASSAIKLLFLEPSSRLAFIVVTVVITLQVCMGMVIVQVYAKTVFTQTDPSKADIYTILFAIVLCGGAAVSAIVTDKAGRRILIISSSTLVFICMMSLGYLLQSNSAPPLVHVILIFVYCFSFMLGAGSIPYVLLAEVFIPEVQNLASMIIIEWLWFLNFLVIVIFPFMKSTFGIYGSFYIFGIIGLGNAITAYFIVPETKGLSNTQIQNAFMSRKKN